MNEDTTQFECVLSDELVGNNLHLGRGQQVIGGDIMQETVTFTHHVLFVLNDLGRCQLH
jgi:hypothetical protein